MALGVVLHACLSLSFVPWVITDEVRTVGMTALFAFIHGFRMPLFFLLSGYFAVMLWQRRGARGLISHRVRRVLVPMVVACFTILPLMEWSVGEGLALRYAPEALEATSRPSRGEDTATDLNRDLWAAARAGDLQRLRALHAEGEDLDARDDFQLTALHWAATEDQVAACELLLDLGADLEATDGSAATPLISGAFWGSADACEALLARGANLEARNGDGTRAVDLANWPWGEDRRGLTAFVAGLLRFDVDLDAMAGRVRRTAAVFAAATPTTSEASDASAPGRRLLEALAGFDLGHLWFLWYLMGLLALGLPVFAVAARWAPADTSTLYVSPLALVAVVPLTATFQAIMLHGGETFFGPSTSSVLVFDPVVLAYYGVFFLFGAAARGIDPDTRSLTRGWPAMLAVAIVIFLAAGDAAESAVGGELEALVPAVMQAAFAWTMTLGLIGLFAKLFRRERAWVRYLSDASYWIYLAHLPLVFLLQGAVARWELPAWQKLGIMVSACLAALLVTYALLVRPTPIGWMLNGRRPARRA